MMINRRVVLVLVVMHVVACAQQVRQRQTGPKLASPEPNRPSLLAMPEPSLTLREMSHDIFFMMAAPMADGGSSITISSSTKDHHPMLINRPASSSLHRLLSSQKRPPKLTRTVELNY